MSSDSKTKVDWNSAGGTGHLLRSAREARNLSARQVAGKLRLDVKQIEAMESDEFTSLVAPVFARGYLRSYARFLELSPDAIVKSYENQKGPMPKVLHGRSVLADVDSSDGDRAMSWVVYLILLASLILGVVWWQTQGTFRFGQAQTAANFEPDLPPSLPDIQEPAAFITDTGVSVPSVPEKFSSLVSPSLTSRPLNSTPAQAASGLPPATVRQLTTGSLPTPSILVSEPIAKPAPIPITATAKPTDLQARQQPAQAAVAQPKPASASADAAPSVVLNLTAESWINIVDATGQQLVYKLLPAGTSKTLKDLKLPLKVVLGNPTGVILKYNGQIFDSSRYYQHGAARFELGPAQISATQ